MKEINQYIRQSVEQGDLGKIKNSLCNIIRQDPGFSTDEFDISLKHVQEHSLNVIADHDDSPFKERKEWSKEYFALELTNLVYNFSKERIDLLKAMSKHLYPKPVVKPAVKQAPDVKTVKTQATPRVEKAGPAGTGNLMVGGIIILAIVLAVVIIMVKG